jgi:hypothetical protein
MDSRIDGTRLPEAAIGVRQDGYNRLDATSRRWAPPKEVRSLSHGGYTPDDGDDVVIRAVGPATEGGRLPLSELARLAGGLQASLERIALSISGGPTRPGRRPREIVDAVRLDFVEFRPGSAVLKVARTGQLSLDDLLNTSLDALEAGINEMRRSPSDPPRHFTPQVINGIRDLTGGISPGNVTRIEFWRAGTVRFAIDETLQAAVRAVQFEPEQQNVTIVGRLHMGDFSPAGLRCRIDTYAGSEPFRVRMRVQSVTVQSVQETPISA